VSASDRLLQALDAPIRRSHVAAACSLLLLGFLVLSVGMFVVARHGVLPSGEPVGQDFSSFYSVGRLTRAGHPALAYDIAAMSAEAATTTPGSSAVYTWHYTPVTHFLATLLAVFPYLPCAYLWTFVTVALYAATARSLSADRWAIALAVAAPSTLWDAWHHQLGCAVAVLLAWGLYLSGRRPFRAGLAIGAMLTKPHLALITPLLLLLGRRWGAIASAAAVVTAALAASYLAFGPETWAAFFAVTARARTQLEQHGFQEAMMPSVFAAVRLLGGSVWAAYLLQAIVALCAVVATALVWRRSPNEHLRTAAGLGAATLLTPYAFAYDQPVATLAIAALAGYGREAALPRGAIGLLTLAWLWPLFWNPIAFVYHLQLGWIVPVIILGVSVFSARSCRDKCHLSVLRLRQTVVPEPVSRTLTQDASSFRLTGGKAEST
jgi:alpha-1,2-mannosyltransferase